MAPRAGGGVAGALLDPTLTDPDPWESSGVPRGHAVSESSPLRAWAAVAMVTALVWLVLTVAAFCYWLVVCDGRYADRALLTWVQYAVVCACYGAVWEYGRRKNGSLRDHPGHVLVASFVAIMTSLAALDIAARMTNIVFPLGPR